MVCPDVCSWGIAYVASKIFGFPDVVVAFVTGMLVTSMAYWVNHIYGEKMEKRKGQVVAINILSGIICLYSLKLIGLW